MAVTLMFPSGSPASLVTVPVIEPPVLRLASIPAVSAPAATVTVLAVSELIWLL